MSSGTNSPIIFFGTEEFSAASLRQLIEDGHNVAAVVTKPDTKKGRGQQLIEPEVKTIASTHGISVWQPKDLNDIITPIKALQPVTGVLVSFGHIIPQKIIDLFTPGIINVHPSHLPRYRGPSPIESAILNGDAETGVSIMQLSAKMDAGPVYHFEPHALSGHETQPELYDTLAFLGAKTLSSALPRIISGELLPKEQNEAGASYCRLISKGDGAIDWNKSATQIEREIRAYKKWPGSRTTLGDVDVIITAATALPENTNFSVSSREQLASLLAYNIPTGDGVLQINRVKPIGKKEMPIEAFLAGYRNRL